MTEAASATPSRQSSTHHFSGLDGLRGVAILMVMWTHFTPARAPADAYSAGQWATNLLHAGWAGVDLFFVLSGFLISDILIETKHAVGMTPVRYFGNFYARRVLRIFPLYYAVLIGAAIGIRFFAGGAQVDAWRERSIWLWLYASNLPQAGIGWAYGFHGLMLNHFWSLAVEEQFYLFWPFLVFLCGRRSLKAACVAMIGLAPALRIYWMLVAHRDHAAFMLTPCRVDAFAIGALLAMAIRGQLAGTVSMMSLRRAGLLLTPIGAVMTLISFRSEVLIQTLGRSGLAITAGGVIVLATQTSLGRRLDNPVLRFFGKYSYGLYALHYLFIDELRRMFPIDRLGVLPAFAGCTLVACLMALVSWRLIEQPFLRMKRFFPMTRPVVAPSPTALPTQPPLVPSCDVNEPMDYIGSPKAA